MCVAHQGTPSLAASTQDVRCRMVLHDAYYASPADPHSTCSTRLVSDATRVIGNSGAVGPTVGIMPEPGRA